MRRPPLQIALVMGLAMLVTSCASIRPPSDVPPVERKLLVTGYCKCRICCGWTRNWMGRAVYASGPKKGQYKIVGQTASGTMAGHGTIAADLSRYPLGTIMYVDGYGYGRVEDTGGRVKGDHIDLYFYSHQDAVEWGRQMQMVKIWAPGK